MVIYTKSTWLDTGGQPGNQVEKPAINISNSGMVNKGIVHKMGLMCHFIEQRKTVFLGGPKIQLLLRDCDYAAEKRRVNPQLCHMCGGSRNRRKEPWTSLEYYSCLHALLLWAPCQQLLLWSHQELLLTGCISLFIQKLYLEWQPLEIWGTLKQVKGYHPALINSHLAGSLSWPRSREQTQCWEGRVGGEEQKEGPHEETLCPC